MQQAAKRKKIISVLNATESYTLFLSFFLSFFLWLYLQHMEVPRLGVEWEVQLLAYATAPETPDPSFIFNLCCSLQQCQILNPLSEARDQARILTDTMSGS